MPPGTSTGARHVVNDRYRLLTALASGGMAEFFLGVARGAEGFSRKVAIKRMLPQLAQNPLIAQMFLAEARLATHLQHQNIATVYDVGQGPEGLFLVMELVEGWDLGVLLRHAQARGVRFPPHLVAFIATQVLAGLAHAYRRRGDGRQVVAAHRLRDLLKQSVITGLIENLRHYEKLLQQQLDIQGTSIFELNIRANDWRVSQHGPLLLLFQVVFALAIGGILAFVLALVQPAEEKLNYALIYVGVCVFLFLLNFAGGRMVGRFRIPMEK
ncbi:serine/threonine protein kinase [Archangium lansingense]|uniref:Protein kinase n=1 Tax=Archangium lansingense TaxID=2995310 RepID=A0ABT4A219_9BACT|nr:protein kinase [Archangium lansinium]MCY1075687.1 protein kinase [Archangium lansinium]